MILLSKEKEYSCLRSDYLFQIQLHQFSCLQLISFTEFIEIKTLLMLLTIVRANLLLLDISGVVLRLVIGLSQEGTTYSKINRKPR